MPCVLMPQVVHIAGYNRFSFTRASAVVNCQSALTRFLLRLSSKAATSSVRVCLSGIRTQTSKEKTMYAAIRQGKAKAGTAEELARTIKEGAIPIISDVPGFQAYYVIYAPDDTVTAISIFDDYASAEESNKRALAWIEQSLAPLLTGPATAVAGPVIVHTLA